MTEKTTKKIPTSRASTAYGLLSEIRALTLDEPKRMHMGIWGGDIGNAVSLGNRAPACGTVGCIGGWVNALVPRSRKKGAADMLGITGDQADELFYGDLCADDGQGTLRHARRVAALIRRFQKANRAQLLAKKV